MSLIHLTLRTVEGKNKTKTGPAGAFVALSEPPNFLFSNIKQIINSEIYLFHNTLCLSLSPAVFRHRL
jgi:hypothetical protein